MNYRIVDGSDKMKTEDIARLLKMTYWADKRPAETIEKSIRNSSCYGIYADGTDRLTGFARVISERRWCRMSFRGRSIQNSGVS